MSFFARLRDRLSGKTHKCDVSFDTEGFSIVSHAEQPISVRWTEIREVCGFKRDLFSIDEICLGFQLDGDRFIWAGEEDVGFDALRSEVERRFFIDAAWFRRIMTPAFVECRTPLWSRE